MFKIITAAAILLLTGCSSLTATKVTLTNDFNADAAAVMLKSGSNTIKGSALLRQQGGGIVTCAGRLVSLIPVTEYSSERITYIYGNTQQGFYPLRSYGGIIFTNTPIEYSKFMKTTVCDTQGYFKFNNIADGDFYIVTTIGWKVGYAQQGGNLMRQVSVNNSAVAEIVLTY